MLHSANKTILFSSNGFQTASSNKTHVTKYHSRQSPKLLIAFHSNMSSQFEIIQSALWRCFKKKSSIQLTLPDQHPNIKSNRQQIWERERERERERVLPVYMYIVIGCWHKFAFIFIITSLFKIFTNHIVTLNWMDDWLYSKIQTFVNL